MALIGGSRNAPCQRGESFIFTFIPSISKTTTESVSSDGGPWRNLCKFKGSLTPKCLRTTALLGRWSECCLKSLNTKHLCKFKGSLTPKCLRTTALLGRWSECCLKSLNTKHLIRGSSVPNGKVWNGQSNYLKETHLPTLAQRVISQI